MDAKYWQNQSSNSSVYIKGFEWRVSLTFNLLFLATCLWYVTAILIFLRKKNVEIVRVRCNHFDQYSLLRMMLMSGVFCFLSILSTTFIIHTPDLGLLQCDVACEIGKDIAVLFHFASQFLIYFYLWLRMKSSYESLGKRTTRFTTLIWVCLMVLVIGCTTNAICWTMPEEHRCEMRGCVVITGKTDSPRLIATFLIAFIHQVFILTLLVKVLKNQSSQVTSAKPTSGNRNSISLLSNPEENSMNQITLFSNARLAMALRKLLTYAVICITSDIIMMVLAIILAESNTDVPSRGITNIPIECTLLVNLITMLCTFTESRSILFPFL